MAKTMPSKKSNSNNKIKNKNESSSSTLASSLSSLSMMMTWSVVFLATPFLWNRQWGTALAVAMVVGVVHLCRQANVALDERDKWKIRLDVMDAPDIVQIMESCRDKEAKPTCAGDKATKGTAEQGRPDDNNNVVIILTAGLATLAKRFDNLRIKQQEMVQETDKKISKRENQHDTKAPTTNPSVHLNGLALLCQEAVYICFRWSENKINDNTNKKNKNSKDKNAQPADQNERQLEAVIEINTAAIALLALIAKNPAVRQRHRYEADLYGLDMPIQIIKQALEDAKDIDGNSMKDAENDNDDALDKEQQAAELQRKSCLLLGALAEGDADMAQLVAGHDGMQVILNAAHWYRYHAEVGNWALWALFILCFEYPPNKALLLSSSSTDGVALTIDIMRNCPHSVEIARHGVALIFDLMRQPEATEDDKKVNKTAPAPRLDVWKIRQTALAAGLHDVLVKAMQEHSDAMDIMMMGSEILVGTGYQGEIPTFEPPEMKNLGMDRS